MTAFRRHWHPLGATRYSYELGPAKAVGFRELGSPQVGVRTHRSTRSGKSWHDLIDEQFERGHGFGMIQVAPGECAHEIANPHAVP